MPRYTNNPLAWSYHPDIRYLVGRRASTARHIRRDISAAEAQRLDTVRLCHSNPDRLREAFIKTITEIRSGDMDWWTDGEYEIEHEWTGEHLFCAWGRVAHHAGVRAENLTEAMSSYNPERVFRANDREGPVAAANELCRIARAKFQEVDC